MPATPPAPKPPVAAAREAGRRVLVTGPPGSGKSREVLRRFDAAVAAVGPDRALLLLPTYGDVEHAKRVALSRQDARGCLDAPYATFTSLGERFLPDYRVGALPSRAARDLLAEAALREAAVEAFERVADRPGFRARFLRLVKEMKQTGGDPARLRADAAAAAQTLASAARERLEGFLRAWEAYDALLAAAGLLDHEDALRSLLARLATVGASALSRVAFLAVDGFDDLTGLERALLDAAADAVTRAGGEVVVALPWDETRPELHDSAKRVIDHLLQDRGFEEVRFRGFHRSAEPLLVRLADRLFAEPAAAPPSAGAGTAVRSLVGADDADQFDRIGREILRLVDRNRTDLPARGATGRGWAFRDFGIVFRRLDGAGGAARRALERLGIPARLVGSGERLASEAAARALRGPLALLGGAAGAGSDFDAAAMLDHLRWRALAGGDPFPIDAVDAADVAWRERGFPPDWTAFRAAFPAPPEELAATLARLAAHRAACAIASGPAAVFTALEAAIDDLLRLPGSGGFDPDGRPLDPEGDARLRRAIAAKARLLDVARGLRDAARATGCLPGLDAAQGVRLLLDAAEEAVCEPPDRRLDAVSLLDAEEARHWELPVVFVAHLVEKEFPLHPREDVFVRDDDRRRLAASAGGGPRARAGAARADETRERRLFLSAVTRARTRLYLCRPAADADGRERAPSFFWRDVNAALFGPDPGAWEQPLGEAPADLGRPCVRPDEAVRGSDLLRFVGATLSAPAFPDTDRDRRLAVALLRGGGDEVAGWLRRAARFRVRVADPLGPDAVPRFAAAVATMSASRATAAAVCPHRFFLAHVVRVPEDGVPFAGPSFDFRVLGSLAHAALKEALDRPDAAPEEVARRAMEGSDAPAPPPGLCDWVERTLVRIVVLFRAREALAVASGFRAAPADLEFAFGDDGEPVSLGEGEGAFRLRGRVDRLDTREGTGSPGGRARVAIVVDYKYGASGLDERRKDLLAGQDLQLPLYARAVEASRGVEVVGVEYVAAYARARVAVHDERYADAFAPRREGDAPCALPPEEFRALLDRAVGRVADFVRAARAGHPDAHRKGPSSAEDCRECPVAGACRPDRGAYRQGGSP